MSRDRMMAIVAAYLSVAGLLSCSSVTLAQNPVFLENGVAQLFIDDYLIDTQRDLSRTLHQPRKDSGGNAPVLALDREFEGLGATLEANGTIVYDPRLKKHVMFTLGYGASSYGKNHPDPQPVSGGGIFRSRLRIDGFVSVDCGTLTTKPLLLRGERLRVNGVGLLRVAVLDAKGESLGEADIQGDSIRHEVSFSGKPLGRLASGHPVRLRFTVGSKGHLYSFTILP